MLYSIHFYENKTYVLNQALRSIPSVNENVKIKGRRGKVISVEHMGNNKYYVFVEFEKLAPKSKLAGRDYRKKRK